MDPDKHDQSGESRPTTPESPVPNSLRPPLPPRPTNLSLMQTRAPTGSDSRLKYRPDLTSGATTAVSMTDVNAFTRPDGMRELRSTPSRLTSSSSVLSPTNGKNSDPGEDSASLRSYQLPSKSAQDTESIFGGGIDSQQPPELNLDNGTDAANRYQVSIAEDPPEVDFAEEFQSVRSTEKNEEVAHTQWKAKKKHFIILSAAGKPIYSRHGSDSIISSYVGIIQTIISAYVSWEDQLRSFMAGQVKFVVLCQTNLFLVAITSLPESEAQLRVQLDALYMQILSTLTLPTLTHLFSVRPSTDLRRPLEGTEVLLSALADSFTRGSPSTLLSALESLRIRKSHRQLINNTLIKARVDDLLYGLVVAGGRLVSVIRPKKHSLHPSDLHLIFNMLFEAEGIKAGGGDSFIPICLPGFNKTGYLYMYVSFLDMTGDAVREVGTDEHIAQEDAVAIILFSASKESFENLHSMKKYIVHELHRNGSMHIIQTAVQNGRPSPTDIVPGTVIRHFLYKSKGNVQFFMPSYSPNYGSTIQRRQLLSLYHTLHSSVHAKNAAVKVQHIVSGYASSLAWVTPMFELYCVASPATPRNALAQSANKVVQWIQREEERIFLIGGAVF